MVAAILVLFAWSVSAHAAHDCQPRADVASHLNSEYGEAQISWGLGKAAAAGQDRKVVELWGKLDLSTWTMIATGVDGMTCIIAAGQDWTDSAAVDAGVSKNK